jgi:addiction module HigA family antidote
MHTIDDLQKRMNDCSKTAGYELDKLLVSITEIIADAMEAEHVTKDELAEKLNKPRAWVTCLMQGKNNTKLSDIVYALHALGYRLNVNFVLLPPTEKMKPAEVFPPGDFLKEELEARGWSVERFAKIADVSTGTVSSIIKGKVTINEHIAVCFSKALGTSADLWLNLERDYREVLQENKL